MSKPHQWTEVLAMADRVEIFRSGMQDDVPLKDDRVDITDPDEVRLLTQLLTVTDEVDSTCRGSGHVTFRLFSDGLELSIVALHDGVALRGAHWDEAAPLATSAKLTAWLARRKVSLSAILATQLKEQRQQNAAIRQRDQAAEDAWMEAIPAALADLRPHLLATGAAGSVPELLVDEADQKLSDAVSDETDRCEQLLAWLGSGTGRMARGPVYEDIPDTLVARLPLSAVKAALKGNPSGAVRLGAAMHLARRGRTKKELATINERVIGQLVSDANLAGWTDVAEELRARVR